MKAEPLKVNGVPIEPPKPAREVELQSGLARIDHLTGAHLHRARTFAAKNRCDVLHALICESVKIDRVPLTMAELEAMPLADLVALQVACGEPFLRAKEHRAAHPSERAPRESRNPGEAEK